MQPFRDRPRIAHCQIWVDQLVEYTSDFRRVRLNLFQSNILKTFKAEIESKLSWVNFWGAVVSHYFMFLTLRHVYAMIHCRVSVWLVRLWKTPKRSSLKGSKMRISRVSTPTLRHAFNVTLYLLKWWFSRIVKHNTARSQTQNSPSFWVPTLR